ncbi:hypothetical protein [Clostridium beijerinckii]|uniref:hypothetical protein n=1 Tax=Clostridium beijerinckii TaxID=1520 RepID=UPI00098C9069|nr:hypothetical protein [Clostridium beijerinckii]MBA8935560.1 hypothetical protein [Clostridium beijerinckii]NRU39955.1 hypothetical protein [Clostridium beijerinckii]NSA96766.1 hypothetical protein [Clostridium beijerinckii]OOM71810.1 hypothetical protein CLBEIC_12240 [Clostridium beijerinckii]CUU47307.1 conserved protein of unknown function [Clostridium beijerinckii]
MKKCEDCDECTYIGEGDYVCIKDEPKIVITEFIIATDDYGQCGNKNKRSYQEPRPKRSK